MDKDSLAGYGAVAVSLVVGITVAWAGSDAGTTVAGVPVFALCVALAFLVQWIVFIPAYRNQSELYFDLTGSVTYITVMLAALLLMSRFDARSVLLAVLVIVWATRLGSFLFSRVRAAGFDRRFNRLKTHFAQFLMTWTLQGLWVTLALAVALAAMTSGNPRELDLAAGLGLVLWLAGFAIEVVADGQKSAFRRDPRNEGRFISSGLWAWSRHPNYFGEILLWSGIAVIAVPTLEGWQWLTLVSPVFVYILLTRISGIPMLERRGQKVWGDDAGYQDYVRETPALWPRAPRRST